MRFALRVTPLCRPLFAALGMSPRASFVELDSVRGTLHVQSGVWFDEDFSLSEIASVSHSTWPWYGGLGVRLGTGGTVAVVGSLSGVVALRFSRPQRMHVLVSVHRSVLKLSLDDPDGFIRAIEEAKEKDQAAHARPN